MSVSQKSASQVKTSDQIHSGPDSDSNANQSGNTTTQIPYGYGANWYLVGLDPELNSHDRALVLTLLYFSVGHSQTWPSNESLALISKVSVSQVKLSLAALQRRGHIVIQKVRPDVRNMTGRVIHLRWIQDPSYLQGRTLPARGSRQIGRPPINEKGSQPIDHPYRKGSQPAGQRVDKKGPVFAERVASPLATKNNNQEKEKNNKPGGVGEVVGPGNGNAESTPPEPRPVQDTTASRLARIREQAEELRPGSGDELARAAQAAILEGHDPGPVQDLALKALEPNVKFPDRWFRDRLVREAAKSGGTLKAKAEIIDSAARAGTWLETKRQRENREQANEELQNQLVQGKAAWEQMTPDQRNAYKADYARRNPGAFPGFVERSCLAEIGAAIGKGEPIQVPEAVQAPPEPTVEPEVQVQTKPRPSKAQEPRPKPRSLGKPRGPVRLADALVGSAGHLIAAQAGV